MRDVDSLISNPSISKTVLIRAATAVFLLVAVVTGSLLITKYGHDGGP